MADLIANLADLQWLNRYLGSHWLLCTAVQGLWRRAGRPTRLRVLDVGTGAGDIPAVLQHWAAHRGIALTVIALDQHHGVLQYLHTAPATTPNVAYVQADGLRLPFPPRTFDIVVCSTMLHHLDWEHGVALLRSMAAVARYGVVVNDLLRGWLHYYAARLLLALTGCHPVTRHDGAMSVLRAYRVQEVREMARQAALAPVRVSAALGYRFVLVYEPPAAPPHQYLSRCRA